MPECGGTLPWEPGRTSTGNSGQASPFSPRPLHAARYFVAEPAEALSQYRASQLVRHLRRLRGGKSFARRELTLVPSHGD